MSHDALSTVQLMRLIRDARSTALAERALLNALALRCRTKEKYKAWPSYERLALDTGLNPVTLKRAARALEAKGLVRRSVRRNQANQWWINVALLSDQAATIAKREEETKRQKNASDCPFASSVAPQPKPASKKTSTNWLGEPEGEDAR